MFRFAFSVLLVALLASCTVNVYDYSTHSGGGYQKPDTVYVSQKPPDTGTEEGSWSEPDETGDLPGPDTLTTRRVLIGGSVYIEECGSWRRYTLLGCASETDGVYLEIAPSVEFATDQDGGETMTSTIGFDCVLQPSMTGSSGSDGTSFRSSVSASDGTGSFSGDTFLTLHAGGEPLAFRRSEARAFLSTGLPGGVVEYQADFPFTERQLRILCTAGSLAASSGDPEFRLLFSDDSRRLLQQFYDIFVLHGGEAPVLPVQSGSGGSRNW